MEDHAILMTLDARWRTVPEIRTRLGLRTGLDLVMALDRLVKSGLIERNVQQTTGSRRRRDRRGAPLVIELYRVNP